MNNIYLQYFILYFCSYISYKITIRKNFEIENSKARLLLNGHQIYILCLPIIFFGSFIEYFVAKEI